MAFDAGDGQQLLERRFATIPLLADLCRRTIGSDIEAADFSGHVMKFVNDKFYTKQLPLKICIMSRNILSLRQIQKSAN